MSHEELRELVGKHLEASQRESVALAAVRQANEVYGALKAKRLAIEKDFVWARPEGHYRMLIPWGEQTVLITWPGGKELVVVTVFDRDGEVVEES